MFRTVSPLLIVFLFLSCKQGTQFPVFHLSHEQRRAHLPFSDAVETDNLLFLTGQIGKDHKSGQLVDGGISAETQQVILNIRDVLDQHQLSLNNVVKCTVILKDINDFSEFNEVYTKYFINKPARTTFAAAGLAGGASIDIDVIAHK